MKSRMSNDVRLFLFYSYEGGTSRILVQHISGYAQLEGRGILLHWTSG